MTEISNIQIGDIVRIRESIHLVPLAENIPDEIPAGIYGQVVDINEQKNGEFLYLVDFHEPYEFVSEIAIGADLLEVMFRFSLN